MYVFNHECISYLYLVFAIFAKRFNFVKKKKIWLPIECIDKIVFDIFGLLIFYTYFDII